jgi:anti-sigma regulatory factor (Ser/Thr protein kinase)
MTGVGVRLVPNEDVGSTVVAVTGLLDLASYPGLRDDLLKVATDAPESVIADIDGLAIAEGALTSVFSVVASRMNDWPGIPFTLVATRPEHLAVLTGQSIDRFVGIHADVGTADRERDHPPRRRAVQLLVATEGASVLARQFVTRVCAEWGIPEHTDDARIIATELVENTLRHTACTPRLRLELRRHVLTVAVGDDDPHPAVLRERPRGGDSGLGLMLVAQVARVWGCSRSASGGKVVWAVVTRRGRLRPVPAA